jgi:protein O-mannosyl-transferase
MRRPATRATHAPIKLPAPVMAQPQLPPWLMAGLLVLMTMAIYWPTTLCDFLHFDDPDFVTSNVHVQNGITWESLKWACVNPVADNWHPLTIWSHMLVCKLCGLKPWGHHLTNAALHALNAGLVFILLQRITGAAWRSLWVAALFAFHPLRVESVAWVSERKDMLSGFFGLLAMIAYARYAQKSAVSDHRSASSCPPSGANARANQPRTATYRALFYVLSLFFFACGLMSKPMLVTWPFVMLLLDYWPLRRWDVSTFRALCSTLFRLVGEKIPFFALAALGSVVAFVVQQHGHSFAVSEGLPLGARVGNALISYCRHLGKLFWPRDLAVFYAHPGYWPLGKVLLAGALVLGVSVLVWARRRRHPYLLVGWLWFVGMLVPVIGLVQTGGQAMADRHTYLPSLGMLLLAIWAAYELTRGSRYQVPALSVAAGVATVLCLALTRQQMGYWRDSELLFRHTLEVTEDNDMVRSNLGIALDRKGRMDEAIRQFHEALRLRPDSPGTHYDLANALGKHGQLDEAIREYEEAIRLKPDHADAHNNLGTAFDKKGRHHEAIREYEEAVRLKPDHALARNNLGIALGREGQMEEAIHQFQETLRLRPDDAEAHYDLGVALMDKGRMDEAIGQFQETLRLKPDDAQAHNYLGLALGQKGQIDEAIRQFQETLRLKPEHAEAHYNLAVGLGQKGDLGEAIRQLQETIRLRPDHVQAHNNLGTAFYQQGQVGEAIQQFQEALKLQPDYADARRNLDAVLAVVGNSPRQPGTSTNR